MRRLLAMLLALCLLAACGDGADQPAPDEIDPGATGQAETEHPASGKSEAAAGQATVMVSTTALGDTLVDGSGRAVYLFDNDSDGTSACYDQCATSWPPLVVQGEPVAGEGADVARLGTIERTDGTMQVTYAGHPLYHFAGDENPGDVNGHGLNDVWWLVRPDGTAIPKSEVGMGY